MIGIRASLHEGLAFRLASRKDGRILGTSEIVFEWTEARRPSRRRVSFDSQRRMLLDDKKFFPLGHYTGSMSVADMEQYKRGPYNFAIQYAGITTAQLDRWQKAGVFVAWGMPSCRSPLISGRLEEWGGGGLGDCGIGGLGE